MKTLCIFLLTVFLLAGCGTVRPAETTLPTAEPTTQPATAHTTAPTQPPETTAPPKTTEATQPEFTPSLWLLEPEYVTYEEYFSSVHDFSESSRSNGWLVTDGVKGIRYWVDSTDYTIHSSVREDVFQIPNSEQWKDYGLIHADGKYAWLISKTQIVMLHMSTGEILQQVQISRSNPLGSVLTDNRVYYFADHSGGQFHIYRVYLPELKVDHLHSFAAPETIFCPQWSTSIYAENSIILETVNPKILSAIEKAIQDPDSDLRFEGNDDFWKSQYPYTDVSPEILKYTIYRMQNALDEPAYVHYIYNYAEDTFTTQCEIICHCEYGTYLPHDHVDPVDYDIAQPTLTEEAWAPIPGMELQEQLRQEQMPEYWDACRFLSFVNIPDKLPYLVEDGVYTRLHTSGVKSRYYSFILEKDEGQGIFYISKDNRLLQLSYDGSICNTLYASDEEITNAVYLDGYFYVQEGEKILQLNIQKGEYRVLIRQPDC